MTNSDLTGYSALQLRDLLGKANIELELRLSEELNRIVGDLISKAKASEISMTDIIQEIQRRTVSSPLVKHVATKKANKVTPWVNGTTYCDPANSANIWIGGKGNKPKWLLSLIPPKKMVQEAQTIKFAEIVRQ